MERTTYYLKYVGAGEQLGNYKEVLRTVCKPEGDREIERERDRETEKERWDRERERERQKGGQ